MSRSQFSFFYPLRVRYSEVDSQGYVFNANHVNFFQTGLTEYFRDLDYDHVSEAPGADFHTVRVVLDIRAPVSFDQEVDLGVRAAPGLEVRVSPGERRSSRLDAADRAVLAATDETLETGRIGEQTWAECERRLDGSPACIELVAAIAAWRLISEITRSLEIPLESGTSSWPPDGTPPGFAG